MVFKKTFALRLMGMAAIVLPFLLLCSCSDKIDPSGENHGGETDGDELVVENGKVRFTLSLDGIPDEFFSCGLLSENLEGRTLRVGGKDYPVELWGGDKYCTRVDESAFGTYSAALLGENSASFYGSSPYIDISLPGTIIPSKKTEYASIPLFCEWKKGDGAVLHFSAPYSLLCIKTDTEGIVSARLSSDSPLSGTFSFIRSSGKYEVKSTRNRVEVNCTAEKSLKGGIPVLLLPDVDAEVSIRLCDGASLMSECSEHISLKAGEAKTLTLSHSPEKNLVFFDGFDRCVWGGNPVEGTDGVSPFETAGTTSGGQSCTGYEDASYSCTSSSAGAGYVQSSFNEKTSTVEENSYMSSSYIASRGFDRYRYLLRVQEFDGCIGVGIHGYTRGWLRLKCQDVLEGLSDISVKFKVCLCPGFSDIIHFTATSGGVITGAKVDGVEVSGEYFTHTQTTSTFLMGAGKVLSVPVSLSDGMKWQNVEVTVRGASETTVLSWLSETNDERINGYYIDDLSVKQIPGTWDRSASNSLRVLYWNIQNGMWADQGNNYDNFVAEVKKYSPDICIWCEGRSNYQSGSSATNKSPYLSGDISSTSGWAVLASRYGHKYLGVAYRSGDNYPQIVTSVYPVTREVLLGNISGGDPITHGAGMFSINCGGTQVNLVTVHLNPTSGETYDNYRLYEIQQILSSTVNASKYSDRTNWIVAGDFNSRSHYDKSYYDLSESAYAVHEYIATYAPSLTDLMHGMYPDRLISSAPYNRIDYVFLSQGLYSRVTDAATVVDTWAGSELTATDLSNFRIPSDHRPILFQIKLK